MAGRRGTLEGLVNEVAAVEKTPLVSVVTPVFNGERYLAECMQSVLDQTYGNFEYLVLDNASTDATADIISEFAAKDPRIRPLRNDHTLPVMENWNSVLATIDPGSRFCKMVHADDLLLPECLERMVAAGIRYPSAAIVAAYRIDGGNVNMTALPFPEEFVSGREICRRRLLGLCDDPWGSPTSVMYRSSDVRGRQPFYNPANIHADTEVCFDLLRAGDYAFVHQVLTYTRRHGGAETVRARREGTHGIARLMIARNYGQHFLTPEEHARAVDLQLGFQYDMLGYQATRLLTDSAFRRRHLDALRQSGARFSFGRLASSWVRMSIKRGQRYVSASLKRGRRSHG